MLSEYERHRFLFTVKVSRVLKERYLLVVLFERERERGVYRVLVYPNTHKYYLYYA